MVEELSSREEQEVGDDALSSDEIKEVFIMWERVQNFVDHPNKEVSGWCMKLLNVNAVFHIRDILKRREKQVSIDTFLVKLPIRQLNGPEPKCWSQ